MRQYIFTITTGRSGQETLTQLIKDNIDSGYVAFESPQVECFFKGKLSNFEKIFRRKFVETHELLGRGKVLTAFADNNALYIQNIVKKKLNTINREMKKNDDQIYVDVSKFFARGLHIGFQEILPTFSLIHLVRDPIENMRSFLNRDKNFYLDNNAPDANSNILKMSVKNMCKHDLYLWSWFEMALRYEFMKCSKQVDKYVEIHTDKLNDCDYINQCLDAVNIKHTIVKNTSIKLNTNIDSGYKKTKVSMSDIKKFENFVDKVPSKFLDKIQYLKTYDPYLLYNTK